MFSFAVSWPQHKNQTLNKICNISFLIKNSDKFRDFRRSQGKKLNAGVLILF